MFLMSFVLMLTIISDHPLAISNTQSWISDSYEYSEEWALDITDFIDPEDAWKGVVSWKTDDLDRNLRVILVRDGQILMFENTVLEDSLRFPFEIEDRPIYSSDYQYAVVNYNREGPNIKIDLIDGEWDTLAVVQRLQSFYWFRPDNYLIEVSHDTLSLLDTGNNRLTFRAFSEDQLSVSYSRECNLIIILSDDSIWAYDDEFDLEWSAERDPASESTELRYFPETTHSTAGDYLVIDQRPDCNVYSTENGDLVSSIVLPYKTFHLAFSPSDSVFVMSFTDDVYPYQDTTMSSSVWVLKLQNGEFVHSSEFSLATFNNIQGMPDMVEVDSVTDTGFLLCNAIYAELSRYFLLSPESEIVWVSDFYPQTDVHLTPSKPFCWQSCNGDPTTSDGIEFWYFDGRLIHRCSVRRR